MIVRSKHLIPRAAKDARYYAGHLFFVLTLRAEWSFKILNDRQTMIKSAAK